MKERVTFHLNSLTHPDFPFRITHANFRRPSTGKASHDFTCLDITVAGYSDYTIEGLTRRIQAGSVCITPRMFSHGHDHIHDLWQYNLNFDAKSDAVFDEDLRSQPMFGYLFDEISPLRPPGDPLIIQLSEEDLRNVTAICRVMFREYNNMRPGSQEIIRALLRSLVMILLRDKESVTSPHNTGIVGAACYIEAHYAEEISMEKLAEQAHISERQLTRRFRELYGMTPHDYLKKCRFGHARSFLLHTETPIGEIGAACGFPDISYFSRAFYKEYGLTPTEFRKK